MATENPGKPVTRQAGTNVTNMRFVKEAADGIVNRCAVAGENADGVIAMISYGQIGSTITAGDEAPVCKSGDVLVESGAAVADGAEVMTDSVGRAITATAGKKKLGRVVNKTSASAAGQALCIELYVRSQSVLVGLLDGFGAVLASASSITPTNRVHHVSGTTAINTIVATGLADGETITLIPDGLWTLGTSGNISVGVTAVVDEAVILTWDATASKFHPSYTVDDVV